MLFVICWEQINEMKCMAASCIMVFKSSCTIVRVPQVNEEKLKTIFHAVLFHILDDDYSQAANVHPS